MGVLQHVPDERGFPGPEETGDDGGGTFSSHDVYPMSGRLGMRAS
jgi:hypothetical protein